MSADLRSMPTKALSDRSTNPPRDAVLIDDSGIAVTEVHDDAPPE
jgi:hypothetical protein